MEGGLKNKVVIFERCIVFYNHLTIIANRYRTFYVHRTPRPPRIEVHVGRMDSRRVFLQERCDASGKSAGGVVVLRRVK